MKYNQSCLQALHLVNIDLINGTEDIHWNSMDMDQNTMVNLFDQVEDNDFNMTSQYSCMSGDHSHVQKIFILISYS